MRPFGHQIGDGVINRVVCVAVVGPVIALEINRLRCSCSTTRRSEFCGGSVVVRSSGCGVEGMRPKYFSMTGIASDSLHVSHHRHHHVGGM